MVWIFPAVNFLWCLVLMRFFFLFTLFLVDLECKFLHTKIYRYVFTMTICFIVLCLGFVNALMSVSIVWRSMGVAA